MPERWTDTLILIKNIGENVTEEQLKELFSDAEDIVIHKDERKKKDNEEITKYMHKYICYIYFPFLFTGCKKVPSLSFFFGNRRRPTLKLLIPLLQTIQNSKAS